MSRFLQVVRYAKKEYFSAKERFDFNVGDVKSYVTTQSETWNVDGSITTNQKMFWYATAAGRLKGVISCPGTTPAMYDVQLQAGWNIVNYVEPVKSLSS